MYNEPFRSQLEALIGKTVFVTMLLILASCGPQLQENPVITVFSAASTADLFSRLAKAYESRHPVRIRISLAASSTLARQIAQGAKADLFISANQNWMTYLEEGDLLQSQAQVLLTNRLVFITPSANPLQANTAELPHFSGRFALADPSHVPAGIYAKQALRALGWWPQLENRLAPAAHARDALRWVALEECQLGLVYATDALAEPKVTVLTRLDATLHDPIQYPIALCRDAEPEAKAFLQFLYGKEAQAIYSELGFGFPEQVPNSSGEG